jgi:hypothetical protein
MKSRFSLLFFVLTAFFGGNCLAQQHINEGMVLQGNVTPFDTPGYPLTLSVPGVYKLISNLKVPASSRGIDIVVPGVVLDLNGFSITQSAGKCTQAATLDVTCTTAPGTIGIRSYFGGQTDGVTIVRNGFVRGFNSGIVIFNTGIVESIVLTHNEDALIVGTYNLDETRASRVADVTAEFNGTAIKMVGGLIERAVLVHNGIGVEGMNGSIAKDASVRDSHITNNATGVIGAALHGTRLANNKVASSASTTY